MLPTRMTRTGQGFQYVRVKGYQRQFAHPAPIFFERVLTELEWTCNVGNMRHAGLTTYEHRTKSVMV